MPKDYVPGQVVSEDPATDNLTMKSIAQNQAIQNDDWQKFEEMNDNHFKDAQVKIENLVSKTDFEKMEADEKDQEENEINTMIEDVWVDFSNNLTISKAKLEKAIKDEVNERLR